MRLQHLGRPSVKTISRRAGGRIAQNAHLTPRSIAAGRGRDNNGGVDASRARRYAALAVLVVGSAAVGAALLLARPTPLRAVQLSTRGVVAPAPGAPELPVPSTTASTSQAGRVATGPKTTVGNRSSTVVELPGAGGGVTVSNSGSATANTGGNTVGEPGGTVVTGAASATGNQASVVVGRP
jgi:hypothetical protein